MAPRAVLNDGRSWRAGFFFGIVYDFDVPPVELFYWVWIRRKAPTEHCARFLRNIASCILGGGFTGHDFRCPGFKTAQSNAAQDVALLEGPRQHAQ